MLPMLRGCFVCDRCAAVLFIDGKFHYTDGVPSKKIMEQFRARNDRLSSLCVFLYGVPVHGVCGKADYHPRVVGNLDWIVDLPGRVAGKEGRGLVRQQGRRRRVAKRIRQSLGSLPSRPRHLDARTPE